MKRKKLLVKFIKIGIVVTALFEVFGLVLFYILLKVVPHSIKGSYKLESFSLHVGVINRILKKYENDT